MSQSQINHHKQNTHYHYQFHSDYAHRDYRYAIVPMYVVAKLRYINSVASQHSRITKAIPLQASLRAWLSLFATTAWQLFIYLTSARYHSYSTTL